MGILRIILSIAVIVAHVQEPLVIFSFFGNGVMAVESFFIISGFYMALVLRTKYQNRIKDFYFNRFIRLYPLYWLFLAFAVILSCAYLLLTGRPLGALISLSQSNLQPLYLVWTSISNLTGLGIDTIILYTRTTGIQLEAFIVISAAWSLSVEIAFYALAPWILRRNFLQQSIIFLLFLGLRTFVFVISGYKWTVWNYFFVLTSMPFFLGGSLVYCLYEQLRSKQWFKAYGSKIGMILITALVLTILIYDKSSILQPQDWRYYLSFALSLPFIFHLTRQNSIDRLIGEYSYPVYLIHSVVLSLYAPLRHFIPENIKIYFVILISIMISTLALKIDQEIQKKFKHSISTS